jgi:drug/metabolite transporter (DMT)-like permease
LAGDSRAAAAAFPFVLAYVVSQVVMWSAHNKALRQLPLLQVTVANLAANTVCSGVLGQALFQERVSVRWASGAFLIVTGTWLILRSQEPSQNQKRREEKDK